MGAENKINFLSTYKRALLIYTYMYIKVDAWKKKNEKKTRQFHKQYVHVFVTIIKVHTENEIVHFCKRKVFCTFFPLYRTLQIMHTQTHFQMYEQKNKNNNNHDFVAGISVFYTIKALLVVEM